VFILERVLKVFLENFYSSSPVNQTASTYNAVCQMALHTYAFSKGTHIVFDRSVLALVHYSNSILLTIHTREAFHLTPIFCGIETIALYKLFFPAMSYSDMIGYVLAAISS
jgi:hypothetical protein